MAKNLKITLHHGIVNRTPAQRATVKTLGQRASERTSSTDFSLVRSL